MVLVIYNTLDQTLEAFKEQGLGFETRATGLKGMFTTVDTKAGTFEFYTRGGKIVNAQPNVNLISHLNIVRGE